MKQIALFIGVLTLSFSALTAGAKDSRESRDVLTEATAKTRGAQISKVSYNIEYQFSPKAKGYTGKTIINLELKNTKKPLSIDALLTKIDSVTVNGKAVADYKSRKGSFDIPAKYLAPQTKIEVAYSNDYSSSGQGLIHFTDPEDSREYLFTD